MVEKFDFGATLKALQSGQPITGKDGVLTLLVKQERTLDKETDATNVAVDRIAGLLEAMQEHKDFRLRFCPESKTGSAIITVPC